MHGAPFARGRHNLNGSADYTQSVTHVESRLACGLDERTSDDHDPRVLARIGPATGIVGWVIALVGYGIHGYPTVGATGRQLVNWAATADPNRFAIGIDIEAVGILIVVLFYAWLSDVIRRAGGPTWLTMFAFALVVVWGAAGIFSNGTWTALLDMGRRGTDAQLLAATRDIAQELFNATYVFFGLAMIALFASTLGGRALPAWLGWPALVIGVGLAIPVTVNFAGLLVIIWAFAVSLLYVMRPATAVVQARASQLPNASE